MNFDVIIIGGGAAGISAALWCDELNLNALLLETEAELGGQLLKVYNPIENHLGIETGSGRELREIFVRQIEKRRFAVRFKANVASLDCARKSVLLGDGEEIFARKIIIASGVRRRKLNVEGEAKFQEKGIIESGRRDAEIVRNKRVCVIGGGDAALENALILAETAANVTLAHRRAEFKARAAFVERAENNSQIEILTETVARKISGATRVEAIEFENLKSGERFEREIEAILIRIGVEPNADFLEGKLSLDERGYIKINQNCETDIEGIFAVGDVANPIAPTVSSAVGMGATAAKAIFAQLNFQ